MVTSSKYIYLSQIQKSLKQFHPPDSYPKKEWWEKDSGHKNHSNLQLGVSNNRGVSPKMDGENSGKPY